MLVPRLRIGKKAEFSTPIRVCIQGATGSIGSSALEVIRAHRDKFKVVALCGGTNVELLATQAREFSPKIVVCGDASSAQKLRSLLGGKISILYGDEGAASASTLDEVELVLAAIVGVAGLRPVMAALVAGKRVALANKESLVSAGALVKECIDRGSGSIVPVDSEHAALFQALQGEFAEDIASLVLTASGGPFLNTPTKELAVITPEDAVRHPRWKMGAKISIDSATLMNKALEIIEAHWLFGVPESQIEVLIHPQSIVHSLVRFVDGSEVAQLSVPDMKGAISYALFYPFGRYSNIMEPLRLGAIGALEFAEPSLDRFPAIGLARDALRAGRAASAVLNAGNERAVELFRSGKLRFVDIVPYTERVLERFSSESVASLDELLDLIQRVKEAEFSGI